MSFALVPAVQEHLPELDSPARSHPATGLLQLQGLAGNRAVTALVARREPLHSGPECDVYEPGEREDSLTSPGTARQSTSGGFSQDLRLENFAVGSGRMKPGHEAEVRRFIQEFDLFDPQSGYEVEFIRGFSDSVDNEDKNAIIREQRAADVEFFMKNNGVPGAPAGTAAAAGSYDAGCDRGGRRTARAVLIRIHKKPAPKPDCTFPIMLGTGRKAGAGTDFTHFDHPAISTASEVKLALWAQVMSGTPLRSFVSDAECELEMDGVLVSLGGAEGHAAFTRFAAGTGGVATHDVTSPLGGLAFRSPAFAASVAVVKAAIDAQLIAQAAGGNLDPCALSVPVPPQTHFTFADGATLKAVIGGTQEETVFLTRFTGSAAKRTYSYDLRFVIRDDFGVDENDLYAPGLMGFWVLQHERSPSKYAPFINELDLITTVTGSF